jgi:hypothetical protein
MTLRPGVGSVVGIAHHTREFTLNFARHKGTHGPGLTDTYSLYVPNITGMKRHRGVTLSGVLFSGTLPRSCKSPLPRS